MPANFNVVACMWLLVTFMHVRSKREDIRKDCATVVHDGKFWANITFSSTFIYLRKELERIFVLYVYGNSKLNNKQKVKFEKCFNERHFNQFENN